MPTAVIITPADIAKRVKSRAGGAEPDAAAEDKEDEPSPMNDIMRSAVEDLVSALGLKVEDVDVDAAVTALHDSFEACYAEEQSKKEKPEKDMS